MFVPSLAANDRLLKFGRGDPKTGVTFGPTMFRRASDALRVRTGRSWAVEIDGVKYVTCGTLAEGGYATVFRVRGHKSRHLFALKRQLLADHDAEKDMMFEIRTHAFCEHPNIMPLLGYKIRPMQGLLARCARPGSRTPPAGRRPSTGGRPLLANARRGPRAGAGGCLRQAAQQSSAC